jgi:hypothetical protein
MIATVSALATNVLDLVWGGLWPAIVLLGLGTIVLPRLPGGRLFIASAGVYILLIVLMALIRGFAYNATWQDSGNRMLVHTVPLLMFWLMLAYGRAFVSLPARSPPPLSSAS